MRPPFDALALIVAHPRFEGMSPFAFDLWEAACVVGMGRDPALAHAVAGRLGLGDTTLNSGVLRRGLPSPRQIADAVRFCHVAFRLHRMERSESVASLCSFASSQSLSRYLREQRGMTVRECRVKWTLPRAVDLLVATMYRGPDDCYLTRWRTMRPIPSRPIYQEAA